MKKIKSFLFVLLFLLVGGFLSSCKKENKELKKAYDDIKIVFSKGENQSSVTQNITLEKTVGKYEITWEISDLSVIDIEGNVRRADEDKAVYIVAKIDDKKTYLEKEFFIIVKKLDSSIVAKKYKIELAEGITTNISNLDEVKENTEVLFTVNIPNNKKIANFIINGKNFKDKLTNNQIKIKVSQNLKLDVSFDDLKYFALTLPAEVSANVSDVTNVLEQTEVILTMATLEGKKISKLLINNVDKKDEIVDNKIKVLLDQNIEVLVEYDTMTYSISFENPSDFTILTSGIDPLKVEHNTEIEVLVNVPLEKMIKKVTINGSEVTCDAENKFKVVVKDNLILKAVFDEIKYRVSFDTDGGKLKVIGDEVFISEYYEGEGANKALEIYNPTNNLINLVDYSIKLFPNGNTTPKAIYNLSKTIAPGKCILIVKDKAKASFKSDADLITDKIFNYNGDDAIGLYKNNVLIDVLGEIGNQVEYGKDKKLVRKANISKPNKTFKISEWDEGDYKDFTTLKKHDIDTLVDANIKDQNILKNAFATDPNVILIKDGFVFDGWATPEGVKFNFTTPITKNIILKAIFNKLHNVLFMLDGGTALGLEVVNQIENNKKILRPNIVPQKPNYTFDNWYKDSALTELFDFETLITEDTIIYAKYIPNKYKVRFFYQTELLQEQDVDYNQNISAMTPLEKEGLVFINWYYEQTFTNLVGFPYLVTGDISFYAKYDIREYEVKFFDDDNELTEHTLHIKHNEQITSLPTPNKTGYSFLAWYNEKTLDNIFVITTPITSNISLYAKFNVQTYLVTFSSNLECYKLNAGSPEAVLTNTNHQYKTMLHFKLKYDQATYKFYKVTINDVEYQIDQTAIDSEFTYEIVDVTNIELKTLPLDKCIVRFDTDGANYIVEQIVNKNANAIKPIDNPVKEGYNFIGWYKEKTYDNVFNFLTEVITEDIIVYAKFEIKSFIIKFFDGSNHLASLNQVINYDELLQNISAPEKDGYIFIGWYNDEALQNEYNFMDKVKNEFNLYARYDKKEFTVRFFDGSEEIASLMKTVLYGEQYGLNPDAPEKEGFDFVQYCKDQTLLVAIDLEHENILDNTIVYLKYKKKVLQVSFFVEGVEKANLKQSITYGEKAVKPDDSNNPHKAGYIFRGWAYEGEIFNFDEITIRKNIDLNAKFEPIRYDVIINPDGGISKNGATELLITEIAYGLGNNQAFEIFNATLKIVNLSQYKFIFETKDGVVLKEIQLTGYLNHNKAVIISNKDATSDVINASNPIKIDFTTLGDASIFKLVKNGEVIDKVGDSLDDEWLNGYKNSLHVRFATIKSPTNSFKWDEWGYFVYDEASIELNQHDIDYNEELLQTYTEKVAHGNKVALPILKREGYVFKGWYIENGGEFDPDTLVYQEYRLIAKWEQAISVTFMLDGGNIPGLELYQNIPIGTLVTNPGIPTKTNYLFIKWINTETNEEFDFSVAPVKKVFIKAIYKFLLEDINKATPDTVIDCLKDSNLGLDATFITDQNKNYIKENFLSLRPDEGFETVASVKQAFDQILINYGHAKKIDDDVNSIVSLHERAKHENNPLLIDFVLFETLKTDLDNASGFITKSLLGINLLHIIPNDILVEIEKLDDVQKQTLKTKVIENDITTIFKILTVYKETIKTLKSAEVKLDEELAQLSIETDILKDITELEILLNGSKYPEIALTWQSGDESVCKVEENKLIFTHFKEDKEVKITVTASLETKTKTKEFTLTVRLKPDINFSTIERLKKDGGNYNGDITKFLKISQDSDKFVVIYTPHKGKKLFNNGSGIRLYEKEILSIKVKTYKIYKIEIVVSDRGNIEINNSAVNPGQNIVVDFSSGVDEVVIKALAGKKNKPTFSKITIYYK